MLTSKLFSFLGSDGSGAFRFRVPPFRRFINLTALPSPVKRFRKLNFAPNQANGETFTEQLFERFQPSMAHIGMYIRIRSIWQLKHYR